MRTSKGRTLNLKFFMLRSINVFIWLENQHKFRSENTNIKFLTDAKRRKKGKKLPKMAQRVRKDTPPKYFFAILRIGAPSEKCGQKVRRPDVWFMVCSSTTAELMLDIEYKKVYLCSKLLISLHLQR